MPIALDAFIVVPRKGFEPPLPLREADFKSAASTVPPPGQYFHESGALPAYTWVCEAGTPVVSSRDCP